MNKKLKILLNIVFIRSASAKLKMKKLVTVLILLFPKHKKILNIIKLTFDVGVTIKA